MGCMAQSRGSELVDKAKVDLVVGTQKYHRVVDYVDEIIRAKEAADGRGALFHRRCR
jgi:tRNA-2-methylthio-N6-dimethylallyladenosine synthase